MIYATIMETGPHDGEVVQVGDEAKEYVVVTQHPFIPSLNMYGGTDITHYQICFHPFTGNCVAVHPDLLDRLKSWTEEK
jgi:hypothetical protein